MAGSSPAMTAQGQRDAVAPATQQNKTRQKTYPRSSGRVYYGRVRSTEGALMKRDESGIGCGARGQETNAPPALGRRRGTARGHYDPPRGARRRRDETERRKRGPAPQRRRDGAPRGATCWQRHVTYTA